MLRTVPNPVKPGLALRLQNTAASVMVVGLAAGLYYVAPYNQPELDQIYGPPGFSIRGGIFLGLATAFYALLVATYFMTIAGVEASKSLRFFGLLARGVKNPVTTFGGGFSREDRLAVLSTMLKAYFGPMMAVSLMGFSLSALANGLSLAETHVGGAGLRNLFDRYGFWFLLQAILFVDVLIFTIGYLVESRRLGNEIKSVDPTLVGWAAALLCYTPFNLVTSKVLGAELTEFPQFENATMHLVLNVLILALWAVYSSASVALGLKASNLTHRGIVSRGPYAVIRHPAYVCKNAAWWIGSVPLVALAFDQSLTSGLQAAASVIGWTLLYVLRALTEEDHLRSVDGAYAAYCAKVRYRFIPGVV